MSSTSNPPKRERAVIVPASAGSGKTYRIAHEYIYDALRNHKRGEEGEGFDPTLYKRILAVTFTNKATEEMKSRILKEIHLIAANKPSDHLEKLMQETGLSEQELRRRAKIVQSAILHDYSHFTVLTNDTFFQRILRAFIRDLGIDINFSTELDSAPVLQKGVEVLIDDIASNSELRKWLEGLTKENIEQGKSWNIRSAIIQLSKELFKESNRDVIERINDKSQLEEVITRFFAHSDKLKGEYTALGEKGLKIMAKWGFTHSDFYRSFTTFFEALAKGEIDAVTPGVIKKAEEAPTSWLCKKRQNEENLLACATELQQVLKEICQERERVDNVINSRNILARNYRSFALLYDLQQKIAEVCRDDNMVLLSDTKHAISKFISEQEAPFIYEKIGNYFDKFMIDEFQDTSFKEWRNFLPLLKNAMSQSDDTSVLIVGDVKQSIYRFRGSDWNILNSVAPKELVDYSSVPLEHNWRSLPNIVDFNNLLFANLTKNGNNVLNDILDEALRSGSISSRTHSELYDTLKNAYSKFEQIAARKHINKGYVDVTFTPLQLSAEEKSGENEALPLYIQRIEQLFEKGYIPRDITILVRNKRDGVTIAKELLAAREQFAAEHRFEITTEEALSVESSSAVKLILSILRLATNRNDTPSLAYYNYIHHKGNFARSLDEEENAFLNQIRMLSPEEAFERIIIEYKDNLVGQTAYVQALHNQIARFSAGKVSDISLFDKWWHEVGREESIRIEKSDRAIEIMTIHKAKGLENRVIIIPFCSWSYAPVSDSLFLNNIVWAEPSATDMLSDLGPFPVPFNNAMGQSVFAEGFYREKVYAFIDAVNLLYVATTRAREQLHIFIKQPPQSSNVGQLLIDALSEHTTTDSDGLIHYTLGSFDSPEINKKGDDKGGITNILLDEYHASPIGAKFRTSASRYFEQDEEHTLSPRSMGIKLHRAFERASTREDITAAVDSMRLDGVLSEQESASLIEQINTTLDNTQAGSWFSREWEHIDCERSILLPSDNTKRPDRIMRRKDEAIVVDYKFGKESHSHAKQIASYISTLRDMGYRKVKGYLWYVTEGKIIEVSTSADNQ